jgi:hypothetical protein
MSNLSILSLFLVITASSAFVPNHFLGNGNHAMSAECSSTAIGPGFLKDLGFEKPDWLPDFGGKKEEEKPAAEAPVANGDDGEEAEAEAAESAEETEAAP